MNLAHNRIGLVDDDAGLCQAVSRLLRIGGFHVDAFPSAEAFLDAHVARLDCLILDIHLGGMSGFDLLDELAFRHEALPTVLITAQENPGSRARATALGAGFLCKPFTNVQLQVAITRAAHPPPIDS